MHIAKKSGSLINYDIEGVNKVGVALGFTPNVPGCRVAG